MNINQAFMYALFLVLMTLKLTGQIAWSWWAVAAPLWVPAAVLLLMFVIAVVAVGYKQTVSGIRKAK